MFLPGFGRDVIRRRDGRHAHTRAAPPHHAKRRPEKYGPGNGRPTLGPSAGFSISALPTRLAGQPRSDLSGSTEGYFRARVLLAWSRVPKRQTTEKPAGLLAAEDQQQPRTGQSSYRETDRGWLGGTGGMAVRDPRSGRTCSAAPKFSSNTWKIRSTVQIGRTKLQLIRC